MRHSTLSTTYLPPTPRAHSPNTLPLSCPPQHPPLTAATLLGIAQLTALFLRPKPWSNRRRLWNLWHWSVGASAAVLAVANIY